MVWFLVITQVAPKRIPITSTYSIWKACQLTKRSFSEFQVTLAAPPDRSRPNLQLAFIIGGKYCQE